MELFRVFCKIVMNNDDANKEIDETTNKAKKSSKNISSAFKKVGSGAATIAKGIATAGVAIGGAFVAASETTREYRVEMGKLETAFTTAGHSAEAAKTTYQGLYSVMGEEDTAVEAANHLAKLVDNEKDLQTWTDICTGVFATFGDSLPLEGLTEAANETAKVGTVTGSLADALNWAGVSEDKFNQKLAACSTEQERSALITKTLNGLYSEASSKYKEVNADIIAAQEAQSKLNDALANFGAVAEPVVSKFKTIAADILLSFSEMTSGILDVIHGDMSLSEFAEGLSSSMGEMGNQVMTMLQDTITNGLPILMQSGNQIMTMLQDAITNGIPILMQSGADLLTAIGEGLRTNIPILINSGLDLLLNFTSTLKANAPRLIQSGLDMIMNLAQGLMNSLPTLISKVPTIVSNIANIINQNAPKLITTAGKLILTLAKGLIQAIPTLVQNIPKIIKAAVDAFLAYNWVSLGKSLIKKLKDGFVGENPTILNAAKKLAESIVGAIKQLPAKLFNLAKNAVLKIVSALKNVGSVKGAAQAIGNAIINTIKTLPSKMLSIGKNIVQGLWNGIKNAKDWVIGKIKGFGDSILSGIKDFFGIHSPSTVMEEEVGKNLALGVAEGIENNAEYAKKSAEEMAQIILDAATKRLDEYKTYNDLTLSNEVAFWDAIRQQCQTGTEARLNADKNYMSAKQSLDEQLKTAEDEYQKKLEETNKKIDDRANAILNSFKLFDEYVSSDPVKGSTLIDGLQSQVDALEEWSQEINILESNIGDTELFEAVQAMGVDSLEQVKAINRMTEEQLQKYVQLYNERQEMARMQAEYELHDEVQSDIAAAWDAYAETCNNLGVTVQKTDKVVNDTMKSMLHLYSTTLSNMENETRSKYASMMQIIDSEFTRELERVRRYVEEMQSLMASVGGGFSSGVSNASKASTNVSKHAAGGILTEPTIFGYSPNSNTYHIGGEAGAEAVAPIDVLMGYVRAAVAGENAAQVGLLQRMVSLLEAILGKDTAVYLNSKEISKAVNKDLGVVL